MYSHYHDIIKSQGIYWSFELIKKYALQSDDFEKTNKKTKYPFRPSAIKDFDMFANHLEIISPDVNTHNPEKHFSPSNRNGRRKIKTYLTNYILKDIYDTKKKFIFDALNDNNTEDCSSEAMRYNYNLLALLPRLKDAPSFPLEILEYYIYAVHDYYVKRFKQNNLFTINSNTTLSILLIGYEEILQSYAGTVLQKTLKSSLHEFNSKFIHNYVQDMYSFLFCSVTDSNFLSHLLYYNHNLDSIIRNSELSNDDIKNITDDFSLSSFLDLPFSVTENHKIISKITYVCNKNI